MADNYDFKPAKRKLLKSLRDGIAELEKAGGGYPTKYLSIAISLLQDLSTEIQNNFMDGSERAKDILTWKVLQNTQTIPDLIAMEAPKVARAAKTRKRKAEQQTKAKKGKTKTNK